jgi:hypothetical protein
MATKKQRPAPVSDPALREIEDHLTSYSFNMDSPATDAEGNVWKKVCFAGPRAILKKLVHHPVAQRLETFTIGDPDDSGSFTSALKVLGAGPPLGALRELRIGTLPEGQEAGELGDRKCGDLALLATACPHLEVLRLLCPGFVAGGHPMLRVLDARIGAKPSSVASLARASLPHLAELHLGFETDEEEGMAPSLIWSSRTLEPLLTGDVLPSLRHLHLWPTQEDDAQLRKAKASPLGRRVTVALRSFDDLEADTDAYTV